MHTTSENEKGAGHHGLPLAGHLGIHIRERERERRKGEGGYAAVTVWREGSGGATKKPPDVSLAVNDDRRFFFFCSGGTGPGWNLQEPMTGAGGAGSTCQCSLRPSELSRQ
jgi:hypothetical protein